MDAIYLDIFEYDDWVVANTYYKRKNGDFRPIATVRGTRYYIADFSIVKSLKTYDDEGRVSGEVFFDKIGTMMNKDGIIEVE